MAIERLLQLEREGATVVIVSPSDAGRTLHFDHHILGDRLYNLLEVKKFHPADVYIYVSDNNDQDIAKQAGFIYVDGWAFV